MANAWQVIGQSNPSATTLTDIGTVPSATEWVAHVVVANRSATPTAFRISLAPNGAADNDSQYIAYDVPIAGNDVYVSPKFGVDATDKVRVFATLATLTFTLTGVVKT